MNQEPEILSVFADRVLERLKKLGWSVSDLARKMGVPHQAIQRYLGPKKRSTPGLETAEKIAKGLGISLYELLAPTTGDHEIEECYRRIGEALKGAKVDGGIQKPERPYLDRLSSLGKNRTQLLEALRIVREEIASLSPAEQDSFVEVIQNWKTQSKK